MKLDGEIAYKKKILVVKDLLCSIIILSNASGGIETTGRYIRSAQIFTKLSCSFYSFFRLLPLNQVTNDEEIFWDWSSIAILARTIIETYNTFFYVGVDNISEEEVKFRFLLMEYHRYSEMSKLYRGFGVESHDSSIINKAMADLKKELESSSVLLQLSLEKSNKNLVKKILSGTVAMHLTHKEIDGRACILGKFFEPYYRLFSNQVHTTPFAFRLQSNEVGRGEKNDLEMYYIITAVDVVIKYMCMAIINITEIFRQQFGDNLCHKHIEKALGYMIA